MYNKLEKLIQQNRENLDSLEPSHDLWDKIQSQLPNTGPGNGPDGGNGGQGGGASAGAKAGALIKWAAAVVTAGVMGTVAFFALQGDKDQSKPDTVLEPGHELVVGNDQNSGAPPLLIQPPVPEADVPFMTFTFNAEKGKTIRLDNGTVITVPPHTFVDKMGAPITGPVELKYREFHDAADLLLSGITMKYHSGDTLADFQTAGMNEIRGSQNGEEIFFAEGKSIGIDLASFTDEKDHRLYYLDEASGHGWTDIGVADIVPNVEKALAKSQLQELPAEPRKPILKGQTQKVLDFAVDYEQFPELRTYKDVQWEYQDVAQLEENQWIFGEAWSEASLKVKDAESGLYTLELKNKRKSFSTPVRPILNAEDYAKELKKFNLRLDAYQKAKAARDEKERWMAMQADLTRHFDISQWGGYNCDRILTRSDLVQPRIKIELPSHPEIDVKDLTVFHFVGQMRACLPYPMNRTERIGFVFNELNAFVVVLPNQEFAVFSPKDFKALDQATIRKENKVTLALQAVEGIHNPEDLRIALGI